MTGRTTVIMLHQRVVPPDVIPCQPNLMSHSELWNLETREEGGQGRVEGNHSFELPSLPLNSRVFPPCNVRMTSGARSSDAMTAAWRDAKNAEIWAPRLPVLDLPVWLGRCYLAPPAIWLPAASQSSRVAVPVSRNFTGLQTVGLQRIYS